MGRYAWEAPDLHCGRRGSAVHPVLLGGAGADSQGAPGGWTNGRDDGHGR